MADGDIEIKVIPSVSFAPAPNGVAHEVSALHQPDGGVILKIDDVVAKVSFDIEIAKQESDAQKDPAPDGESQTTEDGTPA